MKAERIRWVDSIRHPDGWQSVDHYAREAERSMECESLGFVIHERDDSVMLAQSRMIDDGGAVTEVVRIPTVAILERRVLK